MPSSEKLDTHHKALILNLDPSVFGSFAEIGAGQEVSRWFLIATIDELWAAAKVCRVANIMRSYVESL